MARPKKESSTETTSVFTDTAYGMTKVDGKTQIVKVQYNPETGETGNVELEPQEDRASAMNAFKVLVARNIFMVGQ